MIKKKYAKSCEKEGKAFLICHAFKTPFLNVTSFLRKTIFRDEIQQGLCVF